MNAPLPPDGALAPAALRAVLGSYPTGVTIVTAAGPDGAPVGMTANSFASVSLEPPLVLWSAARSASTHDAFAAAPGYAVHFLGAEHHDLALKFAGRGTEADRFTAVPHRTGTAGAPLLDGVAPILECRTWARYEGGDHTILVGEVQRVVSRAHDPLLFHSGRLGPIGPRPPKPPAGGFARDYLAYLLARASQTVSSAFHKELKRAGIQVPEWRVLASLSDEEGLGVTELAAMAILKQPSLTKVLDRLQAGGLIERRGDLTDRRRALVHLTAAGRAKAAPLLVAAKAHEADALAGFTDGERAMIKHALGLLVGRG